MIFKFLTFSVLLIGQSLFCQEKFTFVTDSIKVEFTIIDKGNHFVEDIIVENLSSKNIYVPSMGNKEFFFFCLNERLHSYLGIMSSITGAPNLGGQIQLIEVKPNDAFTLTVRIEKEKPIKFYSFGLDYITSDDKKFIEYRDNELWINTYDYVDINKGLYHKQH
jgi:hypothetical protein